MKLISTKKLYFLLIAVLLIGCTRNTDAPNPPQAEGSLVIELFTALQEKDFSVAAAKLNRLKILNPNDVNISNIEYQVQVDSGLMLAQKFLDERKISEAGSVLEQTIVKYGSRESLIHAQHKIDTIKEINNITERIKKAKTSSQLAIASGELNRIIRKNKFATPLKEFTDYSLDRARRLMSREDVLAFNDLKADVDIAAVTGDTLTSTMMAEIAVEEPLNEVALAYEQLMSKDWQKIDITDSYIKLYDEQLYFRKILNSRDEKIKRRNFRNLLNIPPGDYSSMLIRAFILNDTGYKKEGKALAEIIANDIGLEKKFTENWFNACPGVGNLKDLNNVNPFVLYPFFMYCEKNTNI